MEEKDCVEKGHCQMHGVEIERRKHLEELTHYIPELLTWKNFTKGVVWIGGGLGSLIVVGAFVYTTIVSASAEGRDEALSERMLRYSSEHKQEVDNRAKEIDDKINKLTTQAALNQQSYTNLLRMMQEDRKERKELTKEVRVILNAIKVE